MLEKEVGSRQLPTARTGIIGKHEAQGLAR